MPPLLRRGPSSKVVSVGDRARVIRLETIMETVTATVNRPQSRLATLFTNVIGTNIVYSIRMTVIIGLVILLTVCPVVLPGATPRIRTPCLMPLTIMTVLLIMTLTVNITLNSASTPIENLRVVTLTNALITDIGIVSIGTSAVCRSRRKTKIMTIISIRVLKNARTILETEVWAKVAALTMTPHLTFLGNAVPTLDRAPAIVVEMLRVPVLGRRHMVTSAVGWFRQASCREQLPRLSLV